MGIKWVTSEGQYAEKFKQLHFLHTDFRRSNLYLNVFSSPKSLQEEPQTVIKIPVYILQHAHFAFC